MQRIWRPAASDRSCSPTARAVWPPIPASISSNTSSGCAADPPAGPSAWPCAMLSSASITRESSPPEAISRNGPAGRPAFGASVNSTVSAPRAPPPSTRASIRAAKRASGIASSASRAPIAASSALAAAHRRSVSAPAAAAYSRSAASSSESSEARSPSTEASSSRRARHRSACPRTSPIPQQLLVAEALALLQQGLFLLHARGDALDLLQLVEEEVELPLPRAGQRAELVGPRPQPAQALVALGHHPAQLRHLAPAQGVEDLQL